jgi:hypothetical protein
VFGSLFANFLRDRVGPALAAGGAPPRAAQDPKVLHQLPHEVAAPVVHAYAESLDLVFLCAAPVAMVGFVVALLLKEVPLRDTEAVGLDLGEGFAMPSSESPDKVLEMALGRMMRHSPAVRLRALCASVGCELDIAETWALLQIYRYAQVFGVARLSDIAERPRLPQEVLEPTFNRLVDGGYALRTGDSLWLTQAGRRQVDFLSSAIVEYWADKLEQSPTFDGRPDRDEIQAALERIAHRVLVQRDWAEDRLVAAGSQSA